MRRNCTLVPSSTFISTDANGNGDINNGRQEQEQMTIIYNGRICVYDVTELQAKSIIWFASKETEEATCTSRTLRREMQFLPQTYSDKLRRPNGVSMKSLRQFLEKRRRRIQATSPYYH